MDLPFYILAEGFETEAEAWRTEIGFKTRTTSGLGLPILRI